MGIRKLNRWRGSNSSMTCRRKLEQTEVRACVQEAVLPNGYELCPWNKTEWNLNLDSVT
jgi:hypothetical protein